MSHVGRSLERLHTGQSEPIMVRSAPNVSRVWSIQGSRVLTDVDAGSPAMMPETLQTTLGRVAICFKDLAQS